MSIAQHNLIDYQVAIEPCTDVMKLEQQWLALEQESDCSFFLSWHWIYTWLKTYQAKVNIIRVFYHTKLVGLALISVADERRYGLLSTKKLLLHQTGSPLQDQIWIEYNGFMTHKYHQQLASTAALKYLISEFSGWDEIIIGAITRKQAEIFKQATTFSQHINWSAPTYGVDLIEIRRLDKSYLAHLSKNTRYQITRCKKLYQALGPIDLVKANSLNSALQYFDDIGSLHIKRWGDQERQSGYANPAFTQFHRSLIKASWNEQQSDVWKLTNNKQVLGYFYNFIYKNKVYFYLCGLKQEEDSKLKPGLLGHALCIQYYLDKGMDYYDFMGGNERYKASLGTKKTDLFKASFQKPILKLKAEQYCRKLKRAIIGPH